MKIKLFISTIFNWNMTAKSIQVIFNNFDLFQWIYTIVEKRFVFSRFWDKITSVLFSPFKLVGKKNEFLTFSRIIPNSPKFSSILFLCSCALTPSTDANSFWTTLLGSIENHSSLKTLQIFEVWHFSSTHLSLPRYGIFAISSPISYRICLSK